MLASGRRGWHQGAVKLVLCSVVLAACTAQDTSVDGRDLFAKWCATCHGPEGKPNAQMVAQIHVKDLTAPELRGRVTPALVENQIRIGSANKMMPSFAGTLSDAQIKALAAYVASPQFVTH